MFGLSQLLTRVDRLETRVREQELVINTLCQKLGVDRLSIDPASQLDTTERALLAEGKQIAAIKHHRERTGSSLREAKRVVESAM